MRIVSDFDGVMTEEAAEAEAVGRGHAALVAEALGDAALAAAVMEEMRAEVRRAPERHGWFSGGEIACYADEDPYCFHNAVAYALYAAAPADVITRLHTSGLASAEDFCIRAWGEAEGGFRAANPSHVTQEALGALSTLAAAGADVVIVSNSANERVKALLEGAGLNRFGQAKPRVRSGARKFFLGTEPGAVPAERDLGGRRILLRRPHFFEILREEAPDVVIGDVLSMDLALPLAMRDAGLLEETTLVLTRHAWTPAWVLEACAAGKIEVVDSVAKIPRLLRV